MAVASLVLGILSLVFCLVPVLDLILAIVGLVLGIVGIKAATAKGSGKGLAIAGTVCSGVGLLWALYETFVVLLFASMF